MKKISDWRLLSTEQISSRIFYVIVALSAVLFVLFWLIGYDMPYEEDPEYNAPLLTGVLISFMIVLTIAAVALMTWGLIRSVRKNSDANRVVNNVPARRISLCVAGGFAAVMLLCFLLSDTTPLTINGERYSDTFWLRTAGMFVGASLVMMVAAAAAVVFGATRYIRKK